MASSDCIKSAYFKLSTTDGKLAQISRFKTIGRWRPDRLPPIQYRDDKRIEGNNCKRKESNSFYSGSELRYPFHLRNNDCLRSISPRGTHIMIPEYYNNDDVGFWGIDLRNNVIINDEEICFPIKSKDKSILTCI